MKAHYTIAVLSVAGMLAACAQQDEPGIRPQPIFDKFGGGACEDGWIYVPGTAPERAECVPPDECDDPVYDSAGNVIDCPPPPPRRPDDSGSDEGRDPVTTTTRPPSSAPPRG